MAEIAGEGLVIPPPFYNEVLISLMLDVSSLSLIGLLHSADTEKDSGSAVGKVSYCWVIF